jgi:hypothetical protein
MIPTDQRQDSVPLHCRLAFGLVSAVAGVVGVIMLVAPDPASTAQYFSWGIRPAPVAALVGGCYLASAAVFAVVALRNRWEEARMLCVAALGLTVPTLLATTVDTGLFDFTRFAALAWPLLFLGAPIYFGFVLYRGRNRSGPESPPLSTAAWWLFVALGAAYAVLALLLLVEPTLLGGVTPFELARLSGRFVGSWAAFLAAIAIYTAVRRRAAEAWLAGTVLTLWPLLALATPLRVSAEFAADRRVGYLSTLLLLAVLGAVALAVAQKASLRTGRDQASA